MTVKLCEKEQEVFNAVQSGRWPEACEPALREHVAACPVCGEVVLVAKLFQRDRQVARSEARILEAGVVWMRVQMRARREAAERALLPTSIMERVGWSIAGIALVWGLVWDWPQVQRWLDRVVRMTEPYPHGLPAAFGGPWGQAGTFLLIGLLSAFLVLIGSAVYLLRAED